MKRRSQRTAAQPRSSATWAQLISPSATLNPRSLPQHALELDPDVFERTSRSGVQAQLPSPEDRARYDYTVAKLYAKMGFSDRSLEYLRKAIEEGYKDFKNVYKDTEFAEVRKDKRFTELVATKYPALPE